MHFQCPLAVRKYRSSEVSCDNASTSSTFVLFCGHDVVLEAGQSPTTASYAARSMKSVMVASKAFAPKLLICSM
eukprot:6146691-Amphidinium_carterae.1